jgi:hypothetical protein
MCLILLAEVLPDQDMVASGLVAETRRRSVSPKGHYGSHNHLFVYQNGGHSAEP